MDLMLLIVSAMLLAIDFLLASMYQKGEGNAPVNVFRFNFFIGLFSVAIFFFINGCRIEFTWFSAVFAVLMTSLAILYTLIGFRVLAAGNTAYYSFFLMTGGMAVPYVWGLFCLGEEFSWLRMAGLLLIVGSALVIYADKSKITPKVMLMCAAIFLLNGGVSVFSKHHAISDSAVSSSGYVILTAMVKVVVCGGILLFFRFKKNNSVSKMKPKHIGILVASAFVSGISYLLQLNGAASLPATVVYPIVTGGSIVFTTLVGWLVLKEKPTKQLIVGVLICFAGTCLFL